jgi:hypothetical protein
VGVLEVDALGEAVADPALAAVDLLGLSLDVDSSKGLPGRSTGPCSGTLSSRDGGVHDIGLSAGNSISFSEGCVSDVGELELTAAIRVVLPLLKELVIIKPVLFD